MSSLLGILTHKQISDLRKQHALDLTLHNERQEDEMVAHVKKQGGAQEKFANEQAKKQSDLGDKIKNEQKT